MASDNHRPNGQFANGNTAAKGNHRSGRKPRTTEEKYLKMILTVVTPEVWMEMLEALVDEAICYGNIQAHNALAHYIIGKPKVHVEVEGEVFPITLAESRRLIAERLADIEELEE